MTEANVDRLSKSLKETYRASILKNIGQAQAEAAKFGRLVDKLPTGDLPWHIWYVMKSLVKHMSSAFLRTQYRKRNRGNIAGYPPSYGEPLGEATDYRSPD